MLAFSTSYLQNIYLKPVIVDNARLVPVGTIRIIIPSSYDKRMLVNPTDWTVCIRGLWRICAFFADTQTERNV